MGLRIAADGLRQLTDVQTLGNCVPPLAVDGHSDSRPGCMGVVAVVRGRARLYSGFDVSYCATADPASARETCTRQSSPSGLVKSISPYSMIGGTGFLE